ncbi:IS3 family transposase [Enterococcus mundtii]|uniref:IS3 family transposase n=1 Tax=Enterococcus mundtii TaxID=53346 RepID=UPI000D36830F
MFKEEKFSQESYQSFDYLKKSVCSYMRYYNNYRYSEALNKLLTSSGSELHKNRNRLIRFLHSIIFVF